MDFQRYEIKVLNLIKQFKGSPQIFRLISKFNPEAVKPLSMKHHRQALPSARCLNMPRMMTNGKTSRRLSNVKCAVDLTGDGDLFEDFSFIYIKEPESRARPVVKLKNHICTSLCINLKMTEANLALLKSTPLLLRPMIFGLKRM